MMKKPFRTLALLMAILWIATCLSIGYPAPGLADEAPTEIPTASPSPTNLPSPAETMPVETAPVEMPPSVQPSTEPTDTPTPSGLETASPTESETPSPEASVTPSPNETMVPYAVSPSEAIWDPAAGLPSLTFMLTPADAPMIGIEGVESSLEAGVVTVDAGVLNELGAGEHVLAFLFEGGTRVEVGLTVLPSQLLAGGVTKVCIGKATYEGAALGQDIINEEQHWSWTAASQKLTLSGYDGGAIYAYGGELNITLASRTENKVTTASGSAIDCVYSTPLSISGSGKLIATTTDSCGAVRSGATTISGGDLELKGMTGGFIAGGNILINGGSVRITGSAGRGTGISISEYRKVRVTGGDLIVDGTSSGVGSLSLEGGRVIIRNVKTGVYGPFSASGGTLEVENAQEYGMRVGWPKEPKRTTKTADCEIRIRKCAGTGILVEDNLTVGAGSDITVEANGVALSCANTIAVSSGANLDLRGDLGAIHAKKTTLSGITYTGSYSHVTIKNGVVTSQLSSIYRLAVGDAALEAEDLAFDQSGEGWAWVASSSVLTLNNYSGSAVNAAGGVLNLSLSGTNNLSGDLTATGLSVEGGGSLTAVRIRSSRGMTMTSGTITAQRIDVPGEMLMNGGALALSGEYIAGSNYMGNGLVATRMTMRGGSIDFDPPSDKWGGNVAVLIQSTFAMSGGSITVHSKTNGAIFSTDAAITGGQLVLNSKIKTSKDLSITGGSVRMDTYDICLESEKGSISISGTAYVNLNGYEKSVFSSKTVRIGGKAYKSGFSIVVIQSGKVIEEDNVLPELRIDTADYSYKQLLGDMSGNGWSWSGKKKTLTLKGYNGRTIIVKRDISIELAAGSVNRTTDLGKLLISSESNLTLFGSGRMEGSTVTRSLKITGNPTIIAPYIMIDNGIGSFEGGRIELTDNLDAMYARQLSISNTTIRAKRVLAKTLTVKSSSIRTSNGSISQPDIQCEYKLSFSNSFVMCAYVSCATLGISNSALFMFAGKVGDNDLWVLYKSGTIARDAVIPSGCSFYVPKKTTLKVASGKRLYVHGMLYVDGKVTGKIVGRYDAASVKISGPTIVAPGKKVKLSAKASDAMGTPNTSQTVAWSSDKPGLIGVNSLGEVSASPLASIGEQATITCYMIEDGGVTATMVVTVGIATKHLSIADDLNVLLPTKWTRSLIAGPVTLKALIEPSDASAQVAWSSSNASVAKIDPSTGVLTPLKKGSAMITLAATDGTGTKASIKLTVN